MQNIMSLFSHPIIKNLDLELEKIFQNAPHLPKKAIDILVKITPYLVLISGLYFVVGGLRSIFGINNFYLIFNFWKGISPVYFYLIGLLQILAGAISIVAYKPLKNRGLVGWSALFGLTILELAMNIISVIFLGSGVFGLLLSLVISLFVLYEIKPEYGVIQSATTKVVKEVKKVKKEVKSKLKKK